MLHCVRRSGEAYRFFSICCSYSFLNTRTAKSVRLSAHHQRARCGSLPTRTVSPRSTGKVPSNETHQAKRITAVKTIVARVEKRWWQLGYIFSSSNTGTQSQRIFTGTACGDVAAQPVGSDHHWTEFGCGIRQLQAHIVSPRNQYRILAQTTRRDYQWINRKHSTDRAFRLDEWRHGSTWKCIDNNSSNSNNDKTVDSARHDTRFDFDQARDGIVIAGTAAEVSAGLT